MSEFAVITLAVIAAFALQSVCTAVVFIRLCAPQAWARQPVQSVEKKVVDAKREEARTTDAPGARAADSFASTIPGLSRDSQRVASNIMQCSDVARDILEESMTEEVQ